MDQERVKAIIEKQVVPAGDKFTVKEWGRYGYAEPPVFETLFEAQLNMAHTLRKFKYEPLPVPRNPPNPTSNALYEQKKAERERQQREQEFAHFGAWLMANRSSSNYGNTAEENIEQAIADYQAYLKETEWSRI